MVSKLDYYLVHLYMDKLRFMRRKGYGTASAHMDTVRNTARSATEQLGKRVTEKQVIMALKRVPPDIG